MDPFERRGRIVVKWKRANGIWREVQLPRGATLVQAQELRVKLEVEALHVRLTGELPRGPAQSVRELATWWETTPAAAKLTDRRCISGRLRLWILPALGDLMPAELTQARVVELVDHVASKRSAATARHVFADLRRLVRSAQAERRWPAPDPTEHVRLPPVPRVPRAVLDLVEARALLAGTVDRFQVMAAVVLYLALRKGEVLGLEVVDVDLEHLVLTVKHSHGRAVTKNGRWRTLPIPAGLAAILKPWMHLVRCQRYVFPGRRGKRLNRDLDLAPELRGELVRLKVRTAEHVAGLRFHDLRHTWASLAEVAGVPYELRACVMGHTSSVTERYTHRSMDRLRAALETVIPASH